MSIKQALQQFGLDENLHFQQSGTNPATQIGEKYVLKKFTKPEHAEKIATMHSLLIQENAAVAKHHMTRDGKPYATTDGGYYTLADKLPGASVKIYEGDSQKRVHSLGKGLGTLHRTLRKLDGKIDIHSMDSMGELYGWILTEIRAKKIPVQQEVIDYCTEFSGLYNRLPRQIIHRDPHAGNFLFENDEVVGVVDFDFCQINTRVFDICYAFAPVQEQFDQWLAHRQSFLSGYQEISPLSTDELAAYSYMSVFIELLFIAYWSTKNQAGRLKDSIKSTHWMYSIRDKLVL